MLPQPQTNKRRGWLRLLVVLLIVGLIVGLVVWYNFFRVEEQHFDTMEEYFKYGSIGNESADGIPYYIWLVLPRLFPEHLPPGTGGYTSLGIVWEEGHETPVGFSKKTIGFPRIAINCAFCHSGTYRTTPNQLPQIVPTAPATRVDVQKYVRFLSACADDERFTPDIIMKQINYNIKLSAFDKLLYRYVLIPATKKGLLEQKARFAWTDHRPDWGRGRIDPFNPVKFHQLKLDPKKDDSIGNSDMEPLWNMGRRDGFSLHWDGLNTSLTEVVLSGAIGDGATPHEMPVGKLKELENWLKNVPPPRVPGKPNAELAKNGAEIFKQNCAECHAFGGKRTGTVIPQKEVGTDPNRLQMWSQEASDRYNRYYAKYPWAFKSFVKTDGYVAVALDGLWMRAPYLHNGSVPTVEDLLKPAKDRPKVFYRGYDVYDPEKIGWIHQGDEAARLGWRYDTSVQANSNMGHEGPKYGTELKEEDKRALLEYLKTQ